MEGDTQAEANKSGSSETRTIDRVGDTSVNITQKVDNNAGQEVTQKVDKAEPGGKQDSSLDPMDKSFVCFSLFQIQNLCLSLEIVDRRACACFLIVLFWGYS